MSSYPRSLEGFNRAFEQAKWMARNHPDKSYGLYVDIDRPDEYGLSLASLIAKEKVAPGTAANIIDAEGNMTRMFAEDDGPEPA